MINKQRLLHEFLKLVQITSPSGRERQVADHLKYTLTNLGYTVSEDEAGSAFGSDTGNVIAFLKGTRAAAPALLLSAHMDCVEPCENVKPVVTGGVITSAGQTILGGDDKAGIAPILEVLHILKENNLPHGDLQVIFTIGEESSLVGSRFLDRGQIAADYGFCLDSSGTPGKLVIQAPGQDSIHVKITGKSAHAGIAPEEGINALVVAAKGASLSPSGRIDEETTANVGIIKGGIATNIVPGQAEVFLETRSLQREKLRCQTEKVKAAFHAAAREYGAEVQIDIKHAYESYHLAENSPVVKTGLAAIEKSGLQPTLAATGGGSDANYFNAKGLPCAVLAIGMSKVHTTEEFLLEADLYKTAEITLNIVLETAKLDRHVQG